MNSFISRLFRLLQNPSQLKRLLPGGKASETSYRMNNDVPARAAAGDGENPPNAAGPRPSVSEVPAPQFNVPSTIAELHERLRACEASENMRAWSQGRFSYDELMETGRLRSAKSDFPLAKKLFAQADVASVCRPDCRQAYDAICRQEAALDALVLEEDDRGDAPFEFLIVHSGHAGTTALQNFLCLHPELIVAQKSEMDSAIESASTRDLARKYRQRIAAASIPVHAGMVQHAHIVGRRGGPDVRGGQPGPAIVDDLADIMRSDRFYHLVKHPLEVLQSTYNHNVINQFGGGFAFPGSMNFRTGCRLSFGDDLAWPSSWEIPATGLPMTWSEWRGSDRGPANAEFNPSQEECRSSLRNAFDRLKYAAVGDAYRRRFQEWIPLDTVDFMPGRAHKGLAWLYDQLGVDGSYWSPAFDTLAASPARRAMLGNAIDLAGLGLPLYANLDYTAQALYSHTYPLIELASMEPDERWKQAGFANHPVSLCVPHEQWFMQSERTRKRILSEGIPHFILDKVALPAWIDCYGAWKKVANSQVVGNWLELADRGLCTRDEIRNQMSNDIGRFLEFHPEFFEKWRGLEEVL